MTVEREKTTGLYWFTNDLRIDDNPALHKAALESDKLLCIFCVHPKSIFSDQKAPSRLSRNRQQFLFESLIDLDSRLAEHSQKLLVLFDSPKDAIPQLIARYNITKVYRSNHCGQYERKIWQKLCRHYPMIGFHQTDTHTLFDVEQLPFPLENLPDSFSKFRRVLEKAEKNAKIEIKQPLEDTPKMPPCCPVAEIEWQRQWQQQSLNYQPAEEQLFHGGATAGRIHLEQYFSGNSASSYKETRNGLDGMSYSTKFSPWLSNGSISPRQVVQRLKQYESEVEANESTYWIYFELLWREYFQWYAHCHKAKLFRFNGVKDCNPLTSFYPERFQKWCQGNTPYPIVNACMKQLNTTGYMSNRGRQLVASCFVHELGLDWRYGAAYMEQQLIDFDVASNWGNWQYLAGVGADPRGHRRFDLDKQSRIYDPNGQFIKRWGGAQDCWPLDSRDAVDWPVQAQA